MRQAIQTVRQVKGKWETIRYGFCETHTQRTIDFQGMDDHGWLFRCKENSKHMSHLFHNRPASNVPKTAEEAKLWLQAEIAKQVVKPSRSLT